MTMLIGLALIMLYLLSQGMGLVATIGLWGLAGAYMLLNPQPDPVFASWLAIAGLVTFVIQLALGFGAEEKKKK